MNTIYFYTLYDPVTNKPKCAGIKTGDKIEIYDLFRPGAKKIVNTIFKTIADIREYILRANDNGDLIVTSGFKRSLKTYNFPLDDRDYNIYDLNFDHLLRINSSNSQSKDYELIRKILIKMGNKDIHEYMKLLSNTSVAYQAIEDRGLYINDSLVFPKWSLETFSGRSKSLEFNIQGHHEEDYVSYNDSSNNILIHFDWVSADIRMAAYLSGDEVLTDSFYESDPYTVMMNHINNDSNEKITREECKIYFLKSINSMNVDNTAIESIYPRLSKWIKHCRAITRNEDGELSTALGNKFQVSKAKNSLAVLNGAMQGSVAHAMHNVMRNIWIKCGGYLITEIHDSLILSVPNELPVIKSVISLVVPYMIRPLKGFLENDPEFSVKVSIGKKWKKWVLLETHRSRGVERVKIEK